MDIDKQLMIYSGLPEESKSSAGAAILRIDKRIGRIHSYYRTNKRIVTVRCKLKENF